MKLLIDMNLSPRWVSFFSVAGIEAVHWSKIGPPNAPDSQIMDFAHDNRYIILTQELDFGVLLATARKASPSVLQLRTGDVSPDVLLTVDPKRTRMRLLPLRPRIENASEKDRPL